jgi:hypothetical protein
MGPKVSIDGLAEAIQGSESHLAGVITDAMRGATTTLKSVLRDQITGAGLGQRLANTWRAETYPGSGNALNPAGYAWSAAPEIVDAFSRGATIRPLGDHKYLWIPTRNVPRAPGAGRATSTKKMTPEEVLESFGADDFVILQGKGGRKLALLPQDRALTKRGARRRVRKGRRAHGDAAELVLMFVLATSVTLPAALDLDAAANAGADDFVGRLNEGMRG